VIWTYLLDSVKAHLDNVSEGTHTVYVFFLSRTENWGFLKDYDPMVR
jgi:hypothetical protein